MLNLGVNNQVLGIKYYSVRDATSRVFDSKYLENSSMEYTGILVFS